MKEKPRSEEDKLLDSNVMLQSYQRYLQINYSNEKTRYLYEVQARKFLKDVWNKTKSEPKELTQDMLDEFVIWVNKRRNTNPFYRAWIKSFRLCFDPDEKIFRLKTKLDRSRPRTPLENYDWITKKDVDVLIEKGSPYISLMVRIFFETGRRLSEILNVNLDDKDWDLELVSRSIKGIAKGNVEYKGHFSKETAKAIYKWMTTLPPEHRVQPFMIYGSDDKPLKNPRSAFDYRLKQECKLLGIKATNGNEVHPHCLRHALGRYLTQEKGWKIEQTAVKLGHKNLNNTKKYASPSIEQVEAKEDAEIFDKNEKK